MEPTSDNDAQQRQLEDLRLLALQRAEIARSTYAPEITSNNDIAASYARLALQSLIISNAGGLLAIPAYILSQDNFIDSTDLPNLIRSARYFVAGFGIGVLSSFITYWNWRSITESTILRQANNIEKIYSEYYKTMDHVYDTNYLNENTDRIRKNECEIKSKVFLANITSKLAHITGFSSGLLFVVAVFSSIGIF